MIGARSGSGTGYRTLPRFVHRAVWLPGLVSQSVLLWDGVRLEMKRIVKGHTRISLLPQKIIVSDAPLYASTC